MAYIDKELQLATAHAPTVQGDNLSTHVHDTGPLGGSPTLNTGRDLGAGKQMFLEVLVKTAVTSLGSATVNFKLMSHSTTSVLSGSSHAESGAIAKATLVAGYKFRIALPSANYAQYIGVNAVIGTADLTAGAFEYNIVEHKQDKKAYRSALGTIDT